MGLILLIILGVVWASGYAIAGYCMQHGVSPYGYAFWQSFGPFILLLIIQSVRKDLWLNKSGVIYALLCGLFGIVLPNLLIYFAAVHLPSGLLTVLANISPIFTYLLALAFKEERFSIVRSLLVLFGLVGVGLIILPATHINLNIASWWLYVALLIPLCYAFSAVYVSRFYPKRGNVLSYAMWMLLFSTLCISPLTVINQGYYPLTLNDLNSWLILLEIILSTLGYVLLFVILKRVGAVYYTLVNAIAVISGVLYGWLIFNQAISWLFVAAVIIILVTIGGLSYTQREYLLKNK